MMTHRNNDHGLSEVIGFILILALIITAISIWMTYVVPAQGREMEISHMDYVGQWFLDYKIAVDSLWMNDEIGVTDSTTLTLGSKGGNTQTSGLFLPMMQPIGSGGMLSINSSDTMTVKVDGTTVLDKIPMSTLTYQSDNYYWIYQKYYYQIGGVFLSQNIDGVTGVTNVVSPLISIYTVANSTNVYNPKVVLVPVQVNGGGNIAGKGNARVDFRLQDQQGVTFPNSYNWINISVTVQDPQTAVMWRNLFKDIVTREQLQKSMYPDLPGQTNPGTNQNVAYINIKSPNGPFGTLVVKNASFFTSLNTIASV
jgi:hypothetical protein